MQAIYNKGNEEELSIKNARKQDYRLHYFWLTTHIYQIPHVSKEYFWSRQLNLQIEMQIEMRTELCVNFLI